MYGLEDNTGPGCGVPGLRGPGVCGKHGVRTGFTKINKQQQ